MRTSAEWLRELKASGAEQAGALADLRLYLLRAARHALYRTRARLAHLTRVDLDAVAEDCAQEALVAILAKLDDFRGDSRFTTWAYKFAVNIALVAARREGWKRASLDDVLRSEVSESLDPGLETDPDRVAQRVEAWAAIRDTIDHHLTERQRQALTAVVLQDVPLDELVRHWGSNRNAVYKLLHDARRKLRARLEARGLKAEEVLGLFNASG
ncbi:MAG: RNA polymerase sigma factor [Candidatus Rokuibacteriota bacterium]